MSIKTERVYKYYVLEAAGDVPLLANWLFNNGHGVDSLGNPKAVAVAFHPKGKKGDTLAFATPNEVVSFNIRSAMAPALLGVCRAVLLDQPQVELRMRDMYQDIVDLTTLFATEFKIEPRLVFDELSSACIGDLKQAANIIGLGAVMPHSHYKEAADDAYETALLGGQYEYGIHQYYAKVSLPFARLQAESKLLRDEGKPATWWVSYSDLWLRVFAHFSGDPTLSWIFNDGLPPQATVATTLKVTEPQAHALLLWQAHDREMTALMAHFPQYVDDLPEDLPRWGMELDRHYPTLCASVIMMRNAYRETRKAETMYGRRIRPGKSPGEATSFRIFGTVEDIISVAAVTFWQSRISTEILVTKISGGLDSSIIRIMGEGPSAGKELWKNALSKVASLGRTGPMSIALDPIVTFP